MNKEDFNFKEENGLLFLEEPVEMSTYEFNKLFPDVDMLVKSINKEKDTRGIYLICACTKVELGTLPLYQFVEEQQKAGNSEYKIVMGMTIVEDEMLGGVFY